MREGGSQLDSAVSGRIKCEAGRFESFDDLRLGVCGQRYGAVPTGASESNEDDAQLFGLFWGNSLAKEWPTPQRTLRAACSGTQSVGND